MEATAMDLRRNLKAVFAALDRNETVKILYRGRVKAILTPVRPAAVKVADMKKHPAFGMWKDREDMKDPTAYLNKMRQPRYAI
jgi:hypothetical protein